MERVLSILAGVLGLAIAFGVQRLVGLVRRSSPITVMAVGWTLAVGILVSIIITVESGLMYDQAGPMVDKHWLLQVIGMFLILGGGGAAALIQRDRSTTEWRVLFASLITEASFLGAVAYGEMQGLSDSFSGGAAVLTKTFASLSEVDHLSMVFASSLAVGWILLGALVPVLVTRKVSRPAAPARPAA